MQYTSGFPSKAVGLSLLSGCNPGLGAKVLM